MQIIKQLAQYIRQELCDAKKYAKQAMKYKEKEPKLAVVYYDLSKAELEHATMEHEQAARIIKQKQNQHTDIPESMMIVWEWEHDHMIEQKAHIMNLLNIFKE